MQSYPIVEHFNTLQGEGFYSGSAAYFIRLGGCDVGCVWCDTKESWDASVHPQYSVEQLINLVKEAKANRVVITGGEPLMHDLTDLCKRFQEEKILLNIETSGAYPLSGKWDWVCVSPKKFKPPVASILKQANELKIVVFNKHDFEWAETFEKEVNPDCLLYLQPEWDKKETSSALIIDYIKQHPQWRLSLQTHKYLNIP